MAWCLPTYLTDTFLQKLKSGEIDPVKLSEMTSADRRAFFKEVVGEENAAQVNRLFESKLLLKNQQRGMVTWAKTVAGLKPQAQRDVISRINKLEEALNPATEQAFLEDLVAHKIGNTIRIEEAAKLSELSKIASQKKDAMLNGGDRLEYGKARVAFENYLTDLRDADPRSFGAKTKELLKSPGKLVSDVAGLTKSAKATLDNSWLGRQGWKLIFSNPKQWGKTVVNSFRDIGNTFGGKKVMDYVMADIYSRPNFENYVKDRVAIKVIEEQFPENKLLKKIPGLGKVHEAAENAFTAAAYRNRADLYDIYYDMAKKSGIEDPVGIGIGKLVNSLTSRASLGKLEPSANVINNVFFSGRKIKSDFDFLTAHAFSKDVSPFVKKQAATNLVKTIVGTAGVLALARAMGGGIELNPQSADFGQIKAGNTRYDVTGGMKSIVTLASRMITGYTKSSATGKIYDLDSGKYGSQNRLDVVYNFFENKLSPAASILRDILRQEDFEGNKPTVGSTLSNALVPLPITTGIEAQEDPIPLNRLVAILADQFGISANTYKAKPKALKYKSDKNFDFNFDLEIK